MSCLLTMPLSGNAFYEMVENVTIYKKTYLTMFTPNDHFLNNYNCWQVNYRCSQRTQNYKTLILRWFKIFELI